MSSANLKQRKTFALIRIFGGLGAAIYLSYVVIVNVLAGVPFQGQLVTTALVATGAFGYVAWCLRELSAVARAEREESEHPR